MYLFRTAVTHTIRRSLSVSRSLSENFGYSPEESSYILSRLNDLNNVSGTLIGVSNKSKLQSHLKQNGVFEGLKDLVGVHGLGPKSIKKICDKLISIRGDGGSQLEETSSAAKRRFRLPAMTPALTESQASVIKTVGAVNIGSSEITWCKINHVSKNLEAWDSISLETLATLKKPDLITLITLCKEVAERLPICDTYILEDLYVSGFGGSANASSPRNLLTPIMCTLIHQPPTGGVPKLVLMGGRAVAKWSGRLIGSEKISSQSLVSSIIIKLDNEGLSPGVDASTIPILYAEPSLRNFYRSSQPNLKEGLSDAVLLALAFVDIAIHRRESISQPYT